MSILDVKDRVPNEVLPNGAVRYGVYDKSQNLLRQEYIKREDEPIEEGDAINKVFFDNFQSKAIGYNELDKFEDIIEERGTGKPNATSYTIGSTTPTWVNSAVFKNGNILVAYADSNNKNYGTYVITTQDGRILRSATVFCSLGETTEIKAIPLKDGGMFLCYSHGTSYYSKFIILNEDGTTRVAQTSMYNSTTRYTTGVCLNDGNIFLAYTDGYNGYYAVFTPQGEKVKQTHFRASTSTYYLSSTLLKNGYVMIAYQDAGNNNKGCLILFNETGTVIKSNPIVFSEGNTYYTTCCTFENGNVLIGFQDGSNNNYGKYVIVDEKGNIIQQQTYFKEYYVMKMSSTLLKDGRIVIAFQCYSSSSSYPGRYVVINEDGTKSGFDEFFLNTKADFPSVNTLNNGNVVIAYADSASTRVSVDIKDFGVNKYRRNYIPENIGKPLKNQVLNVIRKEETNIKPLTDIKISSVQCQMIELDNSNIFIGFLEGTNNYGRFLIVNKNGEIVKPITPIAEETAYNMNIFKLDDGNILLLYVLDRKIKFWIFSQDGEVVQEAITVSNSHDIYSIGVTLLDNGNIFALYGEASDTYYTIFTQQGTVVKNPTKVMTGRAPYPRVSKLNNGNVMLLYYYNVSPYSQKVMIVNPVGEIVIEEKEYTSGYARSCVNVETLNNGNVLMIFQKSNTDMLSFSTYMILDQEGNVVKPEMYFNYAGLQYAVIVKKRNGEVVLVFQDLSTNRSDGAIVVLNQEGEIIQEKTTFNTNIMSCISAIEQSNGNLFIVYRENSNYNAEYQIVENIGIDLTNIVSSYSINDYKIENPLAVGYNNLLFDGEKWQMPRKIIEGSYTPDGTYNNSKKIYIPPNPKMVIIYGIKYAKAEYSEGVLMGVLTPERFYGWNHILTSGGILFDWKAYGKPKLFGDYFIPNYGATQGYGFNSTAYSTFYYMAIY